MSVAELVVLEPGEGKTVSVLGDRYTFKATGRATGGRYALVEVTAPASAPGPPLHVHESEEEALYVVEGELTVQIGPRTLQARAGTFALVPRGTVHTFSKVYLNPAADTITSTLAGRGVGFDQWPDTTRAGS